MGSTAWRHSAPSLHIECRGSTEGDSVGSYQLPGPEQKFNGKTMRMLFEVLQSGFRIQGSGCWVQGSGCRVQGSEFRVKG